MADRPKEENCNNLVNDPSGPSNSEIGERELVIDEDKFTRGYPITNRHEVVEMVGHLARMVFKALAEDQTSEKRYARAMTISNKIRNNSTKRKLFMRELIKVPLPVNSTCWNELDADDIELKMIERIAIINDSYPWWKTRVLFSSFMDQETKDLVDQELEEDPPELPKRKVRRPPKKPQAAKIVMIAPAPPVARAPTSPLALAPTPTPTPTPTPRPQLATPQPQPQVATPQPQVAALQPQVAIPQPQVAIPQPQVTTPQPIFARLIPIEPQAPLISTGPPLKVFLPSGLPQQPPPAHQQFLTTFDKSVPINTDINSNPLTTAQRVHRYILMKKAQQKPAWYRVEEPPLTSNSPPSTASKKKGHVRISKSRSDSPTKIKLAISNVNQNQDSDNGRPTLKKKRGRPRKNTNLKTPNHDLNSNLNQDVPRSSSIPQDDDDDDDVVFLGQIIRPVNLSR